MIKRTLFAGFGGQGVLLMGYVLSHGAMHKGLNVTYFPSYGAEMRGGTANCTVTLSDKKIASPVASNPDILVAMNYPSLEKFESTVARGGLILLNSSLIDMDATRSDVEALKVPTVELSPAETIKGMEESLKGKEKFFPLNAKGIDRGFVFVNEGK